MMSEVMTSLDDLFAMQIDVCKRNNMNVAMLFYLLCDLKPLTIPVQITMTSEIDGKQTHCYVEEEVPGTLALRKQIEKLVWQEGNSISLDTSDLIFTGMSGSLPCFWTRAAREHSL